MTVEGRVAVVTGSARNLGRAIAEALAAQGARVVINARSKDKVDQVVDELRARGHQAAPSYQSVATPEGCAGLIADTVRAFGAVHILVNNAAIITYGVIHEMPDQEWLDVINTNLTAQFRTTKAVLSHMMAQQWGRIVNVSANAALAGSANRSHYVAAKGGIVAFTKATAKEYGKYGVTANAIAPYTSNAEDSEEGAAAPYGALYSHHNQTTKPDLQTFSAAPDTVMPRAHPRDVAPLVAFLASEEAWYITGQVVSASGGRWM